MKTLAELWSEKTTPTIRVRHKSWVTGWYMLYGFSPHGLTIGHDNDNMRSYSLGSDVASLPEFELYVEPPATKRVYQALYIYDEEPKWLYVTSRVFSSLEEAQREENDKHQRVICLVQPGFEVPAE